MEHNKQPLEFEQVPQEHTIPLEFPEYVPAKKVKKRGLSKMLAYGAAAFMVLYIGFGYLFPDVLPGLGDNHPEDDPGYVQPTFPNNGQLPDATDKEMFQNYEEDFKTAASLFVDDDYVGATVTIADALKEKYMEYDCSQMSGTVMSYENGVFTELTSEGSKKDADAYLWIEQKTVYYEDDKDGTIYPEDNVVITLVRVNEKKGKNTDLSILQMNVPVNNLIYGYMYCNVSHLHATMDQNFTGENAVLTAFSVSQNDYGADEERVRGNYVIYPSQRVQGDILAGAFYDQVLLQNSGLMLSADKHYVEVSEEYADYGWIYVLGSNGVLDPKGDGYADLTAYTHGTQEFTDKWDEAIEDPDVCGIYYLQGGSFPQVYLKNLSDGSDAWEGYVYDWSTPSFPITDILYPWSILQQHT